MRSFLMRLDVLIILLVIATCFSVFIGVSEVSPIHIHHLTDEQQNILLSSRIPRTVSIIISGSSLAVCGLIMQQLTRNKFVSPTTAGTMDWARLGVLIALIAFPEAHILLKLLFATLLSLFGTMLFMQILRRIQFKDVIFIPLVGIMLGNIVSSFSSFVALRTNAVQSIGNFMQGNFSIITSGRYETLYISVPLLILAFVFANQFTIAGMGKSFSVNLGLHYEKVVNIGLVIASIITALVVVTVGMMPFLGLIVPNLVSLFRGNHLKNALPHTAVFGALFVMICDVIGRLVIFPYEMTIGLTIGVIGSFIFIVMLMKGRSRNA
ncbi:ABC transporter permease [Staphylococcus delphini]|uniref:ABC transporter permease n=1 Tax=Staphylococcus delphini TaxID=53344 RepID=UPI000BBCE015|nr:ABC transporter permease [Staphylococcus delphini]PCF38158.1 iron ABC transporter permease [Staphylococcus delphini]PCF53564.1 iron ABC transporter permease [Staphylococcus delphini]PCF58218.1 iron ABC transporter permease [Staphylococcus delphini]PCF58338.1 iron ABC transporter permease [Staphylococcus delphini]